MDGRPCCTLVYGGPKLRVKNHSAVFARKDEISRGKDVLNYIPEGIEGGELFGIFVRNPFLSFVVGSMD